MIEQAKKQTLTLLSPQAPGHHSSASSDLSSQLSLAASSQGMQSIDLPPEPGSLLPSISRFNYALRILKHNWSQTLRLIVERSQFCKIFKEGHSVKNHPTLRRDLTGQYSSPRPLTVEVDNQPGSMESTYDR